MKDLFLLDPSVVFLNHGSFGACPREVLEVCQGWQRELERNPVAFLGRRSASLLAEAREALARYVGARAGDLVLVANATQGVNAVARSLPLGPGDVVVGTDHEYGACEETWRSVCEARGARYARARIPLPFRSAEFADRVWSEVTDRTRVLFLSHLASATALIFPLGDLCRRARERGILTVIDGAHAPGHLPLDLDGLGADFYTGNCHKWLCAPKGAAFLHARAERHHLLAAPVTSWGSAAERSGQAWHDAYTGSSVLERRLQWQGTRDLAAFLSVPAAIAFQERHGWDRVRAACHGLLTATAERVRALTGLPPAAEDADFGQMAILPFPAQDPARLQERLFEDFRIEIPVTTHEDGVFVRLSLQGYNGQADADALVAALGQLLDEGDVRRG